MNNEANNGAGKMDAKTNNDLHIIFKRGYAQVGKHISVKQARKLMKAGYIYRVRESYTDYSVSPSGILSGLVQLSHKGNRVVTT